MTARRDVLSRLERPQPDRRGERLDPITERFAGFEHAGRWAGPVRPAESSAPVRPGPWSGPWSGPGSP